MNYTAFLQTGIQEQILPYFEGKTVCDRERTYRLRQRLAPGWYRFHISGRYADALSPADSDAETWSLRTTQGYMVQDRLITQTQSEKLHGIPVDEHLPRFAPVVAWRWFDGHLFFAHQAFETEVDLAVRIAYEDELAITAIKGVTPALAQAFVLETARRTLQRELAARQRQESILRDQRKAIRRAHTTLQDRLTLALAHSGAQLMDFRSAQGTEVVVRYRLDRQRYECVVDTESLQILDAGICLEGADRELSLSSLPSAVREASQSGELHVFRHG